MNKKILMSLLLVFIVALSVSAASAADDAVDVVADADDVVVAEGDDPAPADDDDAVALQNLFNTAEAGTTVTLEDREYNVGSAQINITKNITIQGGTNTVITGTGVNGTTVNGKGKTVDAGCMLMVTNDASGTILSGIIFNNSAGKPATGESIHGYGVQLTTTNAIVKDCKFLNLAAGVYASGAKDCTIQNCYFNGTYDVVTGTGSSETGTKAVHIMGGSGIKVLENYFDGAVLDAVSIASGAKDILVKNNIMNGSTYAVFFGGNSAATIENNTFFDCGSATQNGVTKTDYSIISGMKSSSGFNIKDNTFYVRNGNQILYLEPGNTAHGYPSSVGNVNVTGNKVLAIEGVDVSGDTVDFVYISASTPINPTGGIKIEGNELLEGMKSINYWISSWGSEDGDVYIPAADPVQTSLYAVLVSSSENKVVVELKEFNGKGMDETPISYKINDGDEVSAVTDENGQFVLEGLTGNSHIVFTFAGDDNYAASSTEVEFTPADLGNAKINASSATVTAVPNSGSKTYNLAVNLKDADGNILANKNLLVFINGAQQTIKTDANGDAKIAIAYSTATTNKINIVYSGSSATATLTVKKNPTTITAKTTKVKKSQAKKAKVKFLFKSGGVVLKNAKVTLKINGKTYNAKTNAKGIATFKVKLAKKVKTYKYTAKFAGNGRSAAKSLSKNLKVA